mmetsp:Transcript_51186/g.134802  ORF Transcript_51186/g.134802 Transcript_51186/m.134802 type:complete len:112 (+) Transcript_51186:55-390(+)
MALETDDLCLFELTEDIPEEPVVCAADEDSDADTEVASDGSTGSFGVMSCASEAGSVPKWTPTPSCSWHSTISQPFGSPPSPVTWEEDELQFSFFSFSARNNICEQLLASQ